MLANLAQLVAFVFFVFGIYRVSGWTGVFFALFVILVLIGLALDKTEGEVNFSLRRLIADLFHRLGDVADPAPEYVALDVTADETAE